MTDLKPKDQESYEKVIKVIKSCNQVLHFGAAENLMHIWLENAGAHLDMFDEYWDDLKFAHATLCNIFSKHEHDFYARKK